MTYLSPEDVDKVDRIVWTDFEATGLISDSFTVPLEVAAIITDGHLNEIATFGPYTIRATENDLAQMNDFVTAMHTKTGLAAKVLSDEALNIAEVDSLFAAFIAEHVPAKGHYIPAGSVLHTGRAITEDEKHRGGNLGGSSVKYDLSLVETFFPETLALLDYRVIDSSSFREAVRRIDPKVYEIAPKVTPPHIAMEDIRLSISEFRYYTRNALLTGDVVAA
jgi:oligoribonuclease